MNLKRAISVSAGAALCLALGLIGAHKTEAQSSASAIREIPTFQVDPAFPKKVPNDWVWGPASGITVDSKDNIWVITRPREVVDKSLKGKTSLPPVIEFDQAGTLIQGWGGPGGGENYEWPKTEHGITVDSQGNVWIAGRGMGDAQILKFTNGGKFLMQIGHWGKSKGNTDTENLNLPADVTPYPKTNEIFVADGYGNRRVIVFDGQTGKYKRMWSAFGNVPTDPKPGEPVFTAVFHQRALRAHLERRHGVRLRPPESAHSGIHGGRQVCNAGLRGPWRTTPEHRHRNAVRKAARAGGKRAAHQSGIAVAHDVLAGPGAAILVRAGAALPEDLHLRPQDADQAG